MSLVAPYDKPYDFAVSGDPGSFLDLLSPAGLGLGALVMRRRGH